MSIRKTYDQWEKEITVENKRTPVFIKCDCGQLALKAYREEFFVCDTCKTKYDTCLNKIIEEKKE